MRPKAKRVARKVHSRVGGIIWVMWSERVADEKFGRWVYPVCPSSTSILKF